MTGHDVTAAVVVSIVLVRWHSLHACTPSLRSSRAGLLQGTSRQCTTFNCWMQTIEVRLCAARTPVVRRVEGILTRFTGGASIVNDHIAFRTFGARGFGIESVAPAFHELGYTARDTLTFPAKKLHAQWFAPPPTRDRAAGALPRVFISELKARRLAAAVNLLEVR